MLTLPDLDISDDDVDDDPQPAQPDISNAFHGLPGSSARVPVHGVRLAGDSYRSQLHMQWLATQKAKKRRVDSSVAAKLYNSLADTWNNDRLREGDKCIFIDDDGSTQRLHLNQNTLPGIAKQAFLNVGGSQTQARLHGIYGTRHALELMSAFLDWRRKFTHASLTLS